MDQPTVVIIGAGQAGYQVAASLRELKFPGRVVLVGDEPHAPYRRPPLSKSYLMGEAGVEHLTFSPDSFFSKRSIELVSGKRATAIDRTRRVVHFDDASAIGYEHVVLATGARARLLPVPGAELRNVFYLRTLRDADALGAQLGSVRHAVVIGAGFIGLEFAAVAAKRGVKVTVLETAERPMARAVSTCMSDTFTREHAKMGVTLSFGCRVTRLRGSEDTVRAAETHDGRSFDADLVVVGIGVVPNVELAAGAGLPTEDGIVVDEQMRTEDPHVSAIGDVAAHVSRFTKGRRVRLESVQNACDQARCVARRIAGQPAPYDAVPWFWTDQGPHKLQMAGLPAPGGQDVVRGDASGTTFSVFSFVDGRLACVESLNSPADHMLARRLLTKGAAVTPQQAADASFELKSLVQ